MGPLGLVDFTRLINQDKLVRSWNSHFKLHNTHFCPSEIHKGCSGEKDTVLSLGRGAFSSSISGSYCCLE